MAGYNNVQTREEEWVHISLKQVIGIILITLTVQFVKSNVMTSERQTCKQAITTGLRCLGSRLVVRDIYNFLDSACQILSFAGVETRMTGGV